MIAQSLRRALVGTVAGDFSDPTNERIIYISAAGLAIVGVALLVATLVWWRRGRQEHPALAPLEVMGGRAWVKAPDGDRRRRLEQVRLAGAGGSVEEPVVAEPLDLEALVRNVPQAFDDLREPGAVIALPAVAGAEAVVAAKPLAEVDPAVADAEPVVADAVESVAAAVEQVAAVEPAVAAVEPAVKPNVDPTSVSTERPVEVNEALAARPAKPSA